MPEAGEVLQGRVVGGKFHLGPYLGGTDRSAVFRTKILSNGRRSAAIKLIPADPEHADLQLSRWKLIARLSHRHLLQIFESGRCREDGEDMLYVVMEYAEENLAQVLGQRSLTVAETHEMLGPVLEALAYLHGRGFVHGHLKPSNIMVAGDQLKLASDCICQIGEREVAATGTYAPPDPPGTAAAPARDIWSLGMTTVQVLTQLFPVRNRDRVVLPETLPPEFAELAQNCLEPDPQRRCTLPEIAEHLHYKLPARTLGPPPLPAEPVAVAVEQPEVPPTALPAEKNRFAVPLAAMIFTVLATVAGWSLYHREPSQPNPAAMAGEQPNAETASVSGADVSAPPPRSPNGTHAPLPRTAELGERAALKTASVAPAPPLTARENSSPAALVPGSVLQQVLPQVSRSASNTIRGTVRVTVRVRVDPAGNVAGVSMISAGPSRYFARLATDAARQWKFSPAHRNGQNAASAWTIRFEFIRGGVRAIPAPAA